MADVRRRTINLALSGCLAPEQVAGIARTAELLLTQPFDVALCDVTGLRADAASVEALGLLQVAARRLDGRVRVVNASAELEELISFMGLAQALL